MEASNPGAHMNEWWQTHKYKRLNGCRQGRTHQHMYKGRGACSVFAQFTFLAANVDVGQFCCLEVPTPWVCLKYKKLYLGKQNKFELVTSDLKPRLCLVKKKKAPKHGLFVSFFFQLLVHMIYCSATSFEFQLWFTSLHFIAISYKHLSI